MLRALAAPHKRPVRATPAPSSCRSSVCLIFHFRAFAMLLWDERHIRFRSEDAEQLWRLFYRRGGMGRLEMQQVGSPARRPGRGTM